MEAACSWPLLAALASEDGCWARPLAYCTWCCCSYCIYFFDSLWRLPVACADGNWVELWDCSWLFRLASFLDYIPELDGSLLNP